MIHRPQLSARRAAAFHRGAGLVDYSSVWCSSCKRVGYAARCSMCAANSVCRPWVMPPSPPIARVYRASPGGSEEGGAMTELDNLAARLAELEGMVAALWVRLAMIKARMELERHVRAGGLVQ